MVILLVLLFPALALTVDHGASTILGILFLSGIVVLCLKSRPVTGPIGKLLLLAILVYFAGIALNYALTDVSDFEVRRLKRYLRFLTVIPLLYLFVFVRLRQDYFWYAVVFGAGIIGAIAVGGSWAKIFSESHIYRVSGNTNPIIYGNVSLVLFGISLASIGYFQRRSNKHVIIPVIAAVLGLAACILSGTRGAWVALPVYIFLCLSFYWRSFSVRAKLLIIALGILLLGLVYAFPQTGVKGRVVQAQLGVMQYFNGQEVDSPLGIRFELWRFSWEIFKANPLIGDGPSGLVDRISAEVEAGNKDPMYLILNEPHSEYFRVLASFGAIGVLSFLAFYGLVLFIFYRAMRSKDDDVARLGLAGVVFVVGYMIVGLSASPLDYLRSIVFFVFFLALITALIVRYSAPET